MCKTFAFAFGIAIPYTYTLVGLVFGAIWIAYYCNPDTSDSQCHDQMIKTELSGFSTKSCGEDCYNGLYTFSVVDNIGECIILDTDVHTTVNETLANPKYEFDKEYYMYMYTYNGVVVCDSNNARYKDDWQLGVILLTTALAVGVITTVILVAVLKCCMN